MLLSSLWILLTYISFNVAKVSRILTMDCPTGELLRICRPSCEPSCFKHETNCKLICSTVKCVCMQGFVRHKGICIPVEACKLFKKFNRRNQTTAERRKKFFTTPNPIEVTTTLINTTTSPSSLPTPPPIVIIKPDKPPPKCGKYELYTLCVCDSLCEKEKKCSNCTSGCGCFPNHYRDSRGFCIPKFKCPSKLAASKKPVPILKFATIPTTTEGPIPPPPILTTTQFSIQIANQSSLRAPPAITPFIFYRQKRIERKKVALRKLLLKSMKI